MPRAKKFTGRTIVNYVLDESGSMQSCRDATIKGMNAYLGELKKQDNVFLTLTKFNTVTELICSLTAMKDVPEMTEKGYTPDGGTALYDAVGVAVRAIEKNVTDKDRVLCVIDTDGGENASREMTSEAVKKLITEKEAEGNWTFVFLGANQDSWATGSQAMGTQVANTINYTATPQGRINAMRNLGGQTVSYMSSAQAASGNFFEGNVNLSVDPADFKKKPSLKAKKEEKDFFASTTLHGR